MVARRTFLQTSSLTALAALRHRAPWSSARYTVPGTIPPNTTDPDLKALAMRALDAAKSAGAKYADVRFTRTQWRRITAFNYDVDTPQDGEALAVGVRALTKGAWGFSSTSRWSPDLMVQLGKDATENARMTEWPHVPPIELAGPHLKATGNWVTPCRRDALTMSPQEIADFIKSLTSAIVAVGGRITVLLTFQRQERTFASTEGAYTTQTVYTGLTGLPHRADVQSSKIIVGSPQQNAPYVVPFVTPTGGGFELLEDAKMTDHFPEWMDKAIRLSRAAPFKELGEYDVVFDGAAMAQIVHGTLGASLEYDRAVGYEANANTGGISYLAPPFKVLGTSVAPTTVTITADRTLPRGAATVGWDDEGVVPTPFPLVKEGVVVDYATSREFATELTPWYNKHGTPVRSNGCAASENASKVPMVFTPNLVLEPSRTDTTLDALVADIDRGILIRGGTLEMDIQQLTGRGEGAEVYPINHGKVGPPVKGSIYHIHSRDLWKNLVTLGGSSTTDVQGVAMSKGQPNQAAAHSVKAVAAHFSKVRVLPELQG